MAPSQEGRNRCPGKTREYCGHSVRRVAGGRHPEMDSSGRSRLPGLQLPLGTGPRLWPQGGRLCGGHSSQLFFPWGVAWRSHEGIASSAALRLFGYFFFFFSVFTSGQSVCFQLVKTRSTRENNCDRAERPRAPGLEQAGILPNTVLTVPSGPFPLSPHPCSNSDQEPPSRPSTGSVRWDLAPALVLRAEWARCLMPPLFPESPLTAGLPVRPGRVWGQPGTG